MRTVKSGRVYLSVPPVASFSLEYCTLSSRAHVNLGLCLRSEWANQRYQGQRLVLCKTPLQWLTGPTGPTAATTATNHQRTTCDRLVCASCQYALWQFTAYLFYDLIACLHCLSISDPADPVLQYLCFYVPQTRGSPAPVDPQTGQCSASSHCRTSKHCGKGDGQLLHASFAWPAWHSTERRDQIRWHPPPTPAGT